MHPKLLNQQNRGRKLENREKLIKLYKERYGDDAPIPPDHLLERIATGKAQEEFEQMDRSQQQELDQLINMMLSNFKLPDGGFPEDLMSHDNPMWEDMEDSKRDVANTKGSRKNEKES